ncbi:MAG: hypothetical protein P8Z71_02415 [Candidatus Sulfobium sp.]
MSGSREFVEQMEGVTRNLTSGIVSNAIFKKQLAKLNKDVDSLSSDDCRALIRNVVKSAVLFVTKEQAVEFESELNTLFRKYFSQG